MVKVGKLIATEQHLCYAHGVQLAVLDVLYRRCSQVRDSATVSASSTAKKNVSTTATEEADNSDANHNEDEQEQRMEIATENYDVVMELSDEY